MVVFNYRGYSYSDKAKPSEQDIKIDAQAILDFTVRTYSQKSLVVMGKSFGCAVALYMLTLTTVRGEKAC